LFKFEQLKRIHLEISDLCQASCPMCARNFNGGKVNPLLTKNNWTLDNFKKILNQEVLNQIDSFYMCGNYGDPIFNPDLIDMCDYSKNINPNIEISIHTNGGAKYQDWWKKLATSLPKKHKVYFGIDGLEDTHHIYRIGTKFENVIRNAKTFINSGGNAEWVFIKFKHNEHQVEQARQYAKNIGFSTFTIKNTARFVGDTTLAVVDKNNKFKYYIEPPSDTEFNYIDEDTIKNYKEIVKNSEIKCMVQESREIYIDARYNVISCCFLAHIPYYYIQDTDTINHIRKESLEQYQDLISTLGGSDLLNAANRSLKEIIQDSNWQNSWKPFWTTKKLIMCARTCGFKKINIASSPDQTISSEKLH
jgi:MoaA/NifB/PqqE/SkfB family radical SAM enzyme